MSDIINEPVVVPILEFDPDRLVFGDVYMTKKGPKLAPVSYRDSSDNQVKSQVLIHLPSSSGVIFPSHKYNQAQTDEFFDGYQCFYNLTSMKTIDDPTNEEKETMEVLDRIYARVIKYIHEQALKDQERESRDEETLLDPILIAGKKLEKYVRPIYGHPTKRDSNKKKIIKKDKPKQINKLKLLTEGEGNQLKCLCEIYGPGDIALHPKQIVSKPGKMEILMEFKYIFFGGHGSDPYKASCQFGAYNINYVPGGSRPPVKRLLPKNTAKVSMGDIDQVSTGEEDDEDIPEGFLNPNGSGEVVNAKSELLSKNASGNESGNESETEANPEEHDSRAERARVKPKSSQSETKTETKQTKLRTKRKPKSKQTEE